MFNAPFPEIFSKLLPPATETLPPLESIEDKTMRACARMKTEPPT
jgi:hypothetical protein